MVGAKVHLRNNATGEVRTCQDKYWNGDFMWEEGNYSCDCNRYLFFERAGSNMVEPLSYGDCTDGAYDVVRVEFADGTEHPAPAIFNHSTSLI